MKIRALGIIWYPDAEGLEPVREAGGWRNLDPELVARYRKRAGAGDEITDLPEELVEGLVAAGAIELVDEEPKPKPKKNAKTKSTKAAQKKGARSNG